MAKLFGTLAQYFAENEWVVVPVPDDGFLRMGFKGENGEWVCFAQAREEQEQFVFYSSCVERVPEDARSNMAEFLTRANYGMILGNFELDFNDGEVRYKTSIDVSDGKLTSGLIQPVVLANLATMDKYLPGIEAVIAGKLTPQKAIKKIEDTGS